MRSFLDKLTRVIHTILGVPNYEAYIEHFQLHHPNEQPLCRNDFYRQATDEKSSDGKIRRCC